MNEFEPVNITLSPIERRRLRQITKYHENANAINLKRRTKYLEQKEKATPEKDYKFKSFTDVLTGLTEQHKKTTTSFLQSAFKILDTDNFEKTLQNADNVITKFRDCDINANSKKAYYQAVLIGRTDNNIEIPPDQLKKYLIYFEELKLDGYEISKLKRETEVIPEFKTLLELIKTKFGNHSREYLLISIYSEITARDDFHLKLVRSVKETTDETINFLVMPLNIKQNCKIILNKFKTMGDKHPTVNFELSPDLSIGLRIYKNTANLDYCDFMFNKHNGELINRIFKSVGLVGNINTLRQMKASLSNGLSNQIRAEIAHDMLHSTNAQTQYLRKFK